MASSTLNTILPAEICQLIDQTASALNTRDELMTAIRQMSVILNRYGIEELPMICNDWRDGYKEYKIDAAFDPWSQGFEAFWDEEEDLFDPDLVDFCEGRI